MNKYMIATWEYSPAFDIVIKERVLISYKRTKLDKYGDIILKGIRLINPSDIIKVENDCWDWKMEPGKLNTPVPFLLAEPYELFEAPDDESAKLIFELGEYK